MNHSIARMVVLNPYKKKVKLDKDISSLLGIDQRLQQRNLIVSFISFNTNLFYCDIFDKDENLFNGEPTSVLGCFDIAESHFKKADYSTPYPVLRKISLRKGVTSIRISSLVRIRRSLRACPREHRAVVLHAISPISMKLSQVKGSTPKLKKTNWFLFWLFPGGNRPPPVFLGLHQGNRYKIGKMYEALTVLVFNQLL